MPAKVVSTCTTIYSNTHATRHNLPAVFNLILYLYRCLSSLKSALAASIHFSFAIAVLGKAALANAEHGAGPGGCTGSVSQFNDAIWGYFDLVIDRCCSECIAVYHFTLLYHPLSIFIPLDISLHKHHLLLGPTWTSDLCEDTDSALRELRSELRNFGAGPPKKLAPGPCLREKFQRIIMTNLIWGPLLPLTGSKERTAWFKEPLERFDS